MPRPKPSTPHAATSLPSVSLRTSLPAVSLRTQTAPKKPRPKNTAAHKFAPPTAVPPESAGADLESLPAAAPARQERTAGPAAISATAPHGVDRVVLTAGISGALAL